MIPAIVREWKDEEPLFVAPRTYRRIRREIYPGSLYAEFGGVVTPVVPAVAYDGRPPLDARADAADRGVRVIDDSRCLNRISCELRGSRADHYRSLAEKQPLVAAGRVPLEAMQKALSEFHDDLAIHYVQAELADCLPMLSDADAGALPEANATLLDARLYRGNWKLRSDRRGIDASGMNPERDIVPICISSPHGFVDGYGGVLPFSPHMMEVLGADVGYRNYGDVPSFYPPWLAELSYIQELMKENERRDDGLRKLKDGIGKMNASQETKDELARILDITADTRRIPPMYGFRVITWIYPGVLSAMTFGSPEIGDGHSDVLLGSKASMQQIVENYNTLQPLPIGLFFDDRNGSEIVHDGQGFWKVR